MRDDLVEEVDGEIDLLVRENEIDVILQWHLLGSRFHFRSHPLFALKLHCQFLLFLFLFGGFWFLILERLSMTTYNIYESETEKKSPASETRFVSLLQSSLADVSALATRPATSVSLLGA